MKAIVCTKYGPPDAFKLEQVRKPTPGDDEVLIQVHAASVNPYDWHLMRGKPFLVRLMGFGFLKPRHPIPGADVAGRVEAIGENVRQFQPGDEVFGDVSMYGNGAFAEYVCAPEDAWALKPSGMPFEEAAAAPLAAVTALQGLGDKGQVQPGQKVLINGASGGVGTFAVQIAKCFGAEVTGVCSTQNLDLVGSIGADNVIDYTQEDFAKKGSYYDMIFDVVGKRSFSECRPVLNPDGVYVTTDFSPALVLRAPWISMIAHRRMVPMLMRPNQKDLVFVKDLLESGKVVPVIDRCYTLSEVAEAIRYLEEGHARGKVVIRM